MTAKPLPSTDRLRELFDYSPLSGELVWRGGRRAGCVAGSDQNARGYKRVKVDKIQYQAHRLVWKWFHGVDPSGYIHHDRSDKGNQIWSLHDVSPRENCSIEKTIASGLPAGVHFFAGKYVARLVIDGQPTYLGRYLTAEEAEQACQSKLQEVTP